MGRMDFVNYPLAKLGIEFFSVDALNLNPAITWHSPVNTGTWAALACAFSCSA